MRNINEGRPKFVNILHEIVDCGIYDLLKGDHRHSKKKLQKWDKCKPLGWKVVPDCPDILGEFGVNADFDTIEYSKDLIEQFYEHDDKRRLPVIQSRYQDLESVEEYCQWFQHYIDDKPEKLGIGTVCKASSKDFVFKNVKIIRSYFPNAWLHAFGLRVSAIDKVYNLINSYDSASWTRIQPEGYSAKNNQEKNLAFSQYINNVQNKISKINSPIPFSNLFCRHEQITSVFMDNEIGEDEKSVLENADRQGAVLENSYPKSTFFCITCGQQL